MTTFLEVKNNAVSRLLNGITGVASTLDVLASDGPLYPSLFPFHISIDDEIIEVGARSGDILSSLIRGQEGTTKLPHSKDAKVELKVTAGMLQRYQTALEVQEASPHPVSYVSFGTDPVAGVAVGNAIVYGAWIRIT